MEESWSETADSNGGIVSVSNFAPAEYEEIVDESHLYDEGYETDSDFSESTEARRTSRTFQLASVRGVPEIKVEWRKKCRRILGRRVCFKVPRTWKRNSNYTAMVKVSTGRIDNRDVERALKDCVLQAGRKAGVAGALAAFVSGGAGLGVVKQVFVSELKKCLRSKANEFVRIASDIRVELFTKKTTGPWR